MVRRFHTGCLKILQGEHCRAPLRVFAGSVTDPFVDHARLIDLDQLRAVVVRDNQNGTLTARPAQTKVENRHAREHRQRDPCRLPRLQPGHPAYLHRTQKSFRQCAQRHLLFGRARVNCAMHDDSPRIASEMTQVSSRITDLPRGQGPWCGRCAARPVNSGIWSASESEGIAMVTGRRQIEGKESSQTRDYTSSLNEYSGETCCSFRMIVAGPGGPCSFASLRRSRIGIS